MRVLVCGAGNWTDEKAIEHILGCVSNQVRAIGQTLTIIEGQTSSADLVATEWTEANGHHHIRVTGGSTKSIRNQIMIDNGKPDLVIVFDDRGGADITADLMSRAWQAKIPVLLTTHKQVSLPVARDVLGLIWVPSGMTLSVGSAPFFGLDYLSSLAYHLDLDMKLVTYGDLKQTGPIELSDAEISERLDEWEKILGSDE